MPVPYRLSWICSHSSFVDELTNQFTRIWMDMLTTSIYITKEHNVQDVSCKVRSRSIWCISSIGQRMRKYHIRQYKSFVLHHCACALWRFFMHLTQTSVTEKGGGVVFECKTCFFPTKLSFQSVKIWHKELRKRRMSEVSWTFHELLGHVSLYAPVNQEILVLVAKHKWLILHSLASLLLVLVVIYATVVSLFLHVLLSLYFIILCFLLTGS